MVLSFDNAESANGTPEPHHDDDRGEPSRHIGIADEQDSETKKQRIESRVHATCLPHRGRNVTFGDSRILISRKAIATARVSFEFSID